MNAKQVSNKNWTVAVIIGSSIPILLIIIGILTELAKAFQPYTGIVDTTNENAVFFGGLFLAIPFGLLDIFAGNFALSKGLVEKKMAVTGIIIGGFGLLLGILSWILFHMFTSFVF
jgi:hypothetical protein